MIRPFLTALVVTMFLATTAMHGVSAASPQALRPKVPSYPESEKDLKKLMEDMLKAARNKDGQKLAQQALSLALPDPSSWFLQVFESVDGRKLSAEYKRTAQSLAPSFILEFERIVREKLYHVSVREFTEACDGNANEQQYPVLLARLQPVRLYEARFVNAAGRGRSIWFFAYVGGGFRYIGLPQVSPASIPGSPDMEEPSSDPTQESALMNPLTVSGKDQQARRIGGNRPTYPVEARASGVQGTVRLEAIIGRDGKVYRLRLVQGHCWLVNAAVEAVRTWQYTPALSEGRPVPVQTIIEVIFRLG